MGEIKVSFLVPTLGERIDELERLFNSIAAQSVKECEIVLVLQDNFSLIKSICKKWEYTLNIKIIETKKKGLSKARNLGIPICKGRYIVLSDDDCWYPNDAVERIDHYFCGNDIDVLLTKIYDPNTKQDYKEYGSQEEMIRSKLKLLNRSSIEIAFKNIYAGTMFDESFGLGGQFVCCEEADFLFRLFERGAKIKYIPTITVYHEKKKNGSTRKQIIAKGAFYSKHYNCFVGTLICIKDFILRHENNFKAFFEGVHEYKQIERIN